MFKHIRPLSIPIARTHTARTVVVTRRFNAAHRNAQSQQSAYVEEQSVNPALLVLKFGRRVAKFTLFGLLAIGVPIVGTYIGTHLWVEHFCFVPETDNEARAWEWHFDSRDWTGDSAARGTDPALPSYWDKGFALRKYTKTEDGNLDNIKFNDPPLQTMDEYFQYAIAHIDDKHVVLSRPYTLPGLLFLHGTVLEGLGDLRKAKEVYQRAWEALPTHDFGGARIAEKLGNVSSRLGDSNDTLGWWARAIQLAQHKVPGDLDAVPEVPQQAPSSPFLQRILADTLVSLSLHYARNGELYQAAYVEEASLKLIRSIHGFDSISAGSTFDVLHKLYLLQRTSLLSVHLAEVEYILHRSPARSIQHLVAATDASERVARALVDHSTDSSGKSSGQLPDNVQSSPSFSAWNLMGVLHENNEGPKSKAAFECYEKAVVWGGTPSETPNGIIVAAEHTLQREWNTYWGNYQRTKQALEISDIQK
ncbi:hypothetical protein BDQ17DRAFT_1353518 [Cyathus striatus]|nr:hypothetical protein BDQ17DRAFT_1353518 [Cyathus striatus]